GYSYNEEYEEILKVRSETIKKDLEEGKTNLFYLGLHLLDLYTSNAYGVRYARVSRVELRIDGLNIPIGAGNCCAAFFFDYCEKEFDLEKSQVSRYMNIVVEFGDEGRGFKQEWQAFSYSQLSELLPMSAEDRKKVTPDMTVKMIRELKKTLVATSQQENKGGTSAAKPPENEKYERFDGWKKTQFCDRIIELEAECEIYKKQVAELKAQLKTEPKAKSKKSGSIAV
ncbi:MAG: hypothetical protein LUD19_01140, partial [Clostridia bacterium]|nr:hypothetical protein [Clostridia bacterium]